MATFSGPSQAPYIPHSCAHCRKFVISPLGHRQPRRGEFTYRLPYSVPEARVAAKDGCSLYRAFIGLIIGHTKRSEAVRSILNHINSDSEENHGERLSGGLRYFVVQLAERLTKHPFRIDIRKQRRTDTKKAILAVYECFGGTIWLEVNACAGTEFAYNHIQWLLIPSKMTQHLPYAMFDPSTGT